MPARSERGERMICTAHPSTSRDLSHLLHAPADAGERRGWPLVVFLHGSGERGDDLQLARRYGLPHVLDCGGVLHAYVLVPQCAAGTEWHDVLDRLEATVECVGREHPVATDRIRVTGFSLGGFRAWAWALRSPDRIAALAPVAGSRVTDVDHDLRPLARTAIWMCHGAVDRHVPVDGADSVARTLEGCGVLLRYARYPDADHGQTCRRAYADGEFLVWPGGRFA